MINRKKIFLLSFLLAACAIISAAANYPFPQFQQPDQTNPPPLSDKEVATIIEQSFQDWLDHYVTAEGAPAGAYRVHRAEAYNQETVSEGIGWGMLITVLLDTPQRPTRHYFNGFWKYYTKYLNKKGLMSWKISKSGKVLGEDSATEADQNVAMALFYAHKQWGSSKNLNYLAEAKKLLAKIWRQTVTENDYVLKPGASWGGYEITNPAYYNPAYYRVWQNTDRQWQMVGQRAEKLYNYFNQHYSTGLLPDWCMGDGSSAFLSYNFTYDACQVPLKLGIDFFWHQQQGQRLKKFSRWAFKKTNGRPEEFKDGYRLDGTVIGSYSNAAFIGPLCVAAATDRENARWFEDLFHYLVKIETGGRWGYYPDTIRLVSLLVVTGNFPNFWEEIYQRTPVDPHRS